MPLVLPPQREAAPHHSLSHIPAPRLAVQYPSRRLLSVFSIYLRWFMGRAFRAVRLAHAERFPQLSPNSATIVCANHPSWWDPLIAFVLSRRLAPHASHYAPMDATALERYGFMRRLGMFPLDPRSPQAGAHFLRTAGEILERPNSMLWMTPEGQFTDVRRRPTQWKPGIAALVARQSQCTVIPLALEYTFWDERLPEALVLLGEPLQIEDGRSARSDHWRTVLTQAMTRTQDELAALSMARDPAAFVTLLEGKSGVTGPYNLWKRAQARWHGRPYSADHGANQGANKGGVQPS